MNEITESHLNLQVKWNPNDTTRQFYFKSSEAFVKIENYMVLPFYQYTYTDTSNIVTYCTFDWGSSIRIHEYGPAVPAIDMADLIRLFLKKTQTINNKSVNNLSK